MTVTPTPTGDSLTADARLTHLLVASALGVYLLIVVGATTSLLDGAAACPTWPACNGQWFVTLSEPGLAVAWGHRLVTLLVGLLLLATTIYAWFRAVDRQVRLVLGITTILYPGQVALGALTAVTGASTLLSAIHLVVAMIIFSTLLVALLWQLESETPTTDAAVSTEPRSVADDLTVSEQAITTIHTRSNRTISGYADRTITRARAYLALTKPKLMWLLCLVALAAMGLAAGPTLDPVTAVATLAGGVLAIGASGTFNNVLERDIDRRMNRTADRPLVEGLVSPRRATIFGLVLASASVGVFIVFVNVLAAALGVLAILFYSVVYTLLLKPHTTQNIVIGGAVGSFPALIGWAAVENTVGLPALVLGAVIFLWTPAHFYNLALAYREDYANAGFPMLPVVRGAPTTRRHILLYLGATLIGTVVLGATTRLDWPYAITVVIVGAVFLWAVVRLFEENTERAAFRTFYASNGYLGGLLLAILVDTIVI
jgi:protoheme IX farnesyltransferase